jgi:cytochrome d ubiquinol oxidase subunit I
MTAGNKDAYVPGLIDQVNGNTDRGIISVAEKTEKGKIARQTLMDYKKAKESNDNEQVTALLKKFQDNDFRENYFKYFGYAFINSPEDVIPDIYGAFYSFHFMVILGFLFILIFSLALIFLFSGTITSQRWFLHVVLFSIPLPYLASELGWILTEMGRQPWIIQDLMPVSIGVSNIDTGSVQITFWLFAFLFTALLIAEISIMLKQIKTGPKH